MRFSCFFLSSLVLLHSFYVSSSLPNDHLVSGQKNFIKWLIEPLKSNIQDHSHRKKMIFSDLPEDCQLNILDILDLYCLLTISQTSKELCCLATNVFVRKFSMKTVVIGSLTPPGHYYDDSDSDSSLEDIGLGFLSKTLSVFGWKTKSPEVRVIPKMVNGDLIEVKAAELSLKLLRHFGNVIKRLRIYYSYFNANETTILSRSINEYCSKSLVSLEISHCNGNTLKHMTRPFEHVESVYFAHQLDKIKNKNVRMNQLFPQIRRISLGFAKDLNEHFIDCHLPYLEHFHIHMGLGENSHKARAIEKKIEQFLRKNPSIQSVSLQNISQRFLKPLSELLPDIKHFTLHTFYFGNKEIHFFGKVTKFVVRNSLGSPKNLLMPNLEELWMNCNAQHCKQWFSFLECHKNLSRFYIEESNLNDETFINLTMNMTNLKDFSISLLKGEFIGADSIFKFIEGHENLMKFSMTPLPIQEEQIIREKLEHSWHIRNGRTRICLEKKKT